MMDYRNNYNNENETCPNQRLKNCLEVVTTLSNRSIWWKAKRTSCMILVNASLSSLVVERLTTLGLTMA